MTNPYFRNVPDFAYVNRKPGEQTLSNFIEVKNLFKRVKIREDIFQNLAFFDKYTILGDERPDNVAHKFYGDPTLDWIVLLCNNIINIQSEWPLTQATLDKVMLEKYGSYEALYSNIHHYETVETKNLSGITILKAGLIVPEDFTLVYYDSVLGEEVVRDSTEITVEVTNYEYETRLEDAKRNIFIIKPRFLGLILNDVAAIMPYKKGSTQYVSATLKQADNIRLYE